MHPDKLQMREVTGKVTDEKALAVTHRPFTFGYGTQWLKQTRMPAPVTSGRRLKTLALSDPSSAEYSVPRLCLGCASGTGIQVCDPLIKNGRVFTPTKFLLL